MSLLELPQELLDSILDIVLTNGAFESFVLSCKTAHRASKERIKRHHELRTAWRTVPSAQNTRRCPTALSIIEAIVCEPEAAWFVENLDLSGMPDLDKDDDSGDWQIQDEEVLRRAKQLIQESLAIKAAGQPAEGWMYAVQDDHDQQMSALTNTAQAMGEEESRIRRWNHPRSSWNVGTQHEFMQVIRTIVLLTLLPNLKDLTLPTSFGYITGHFQDRGPLYFLELLNSMARQACASPNEHLPLSRLERLRPFEEVESQYSPKTGFAELAPFTVLPRMVELDLRNMIATNADEDHPSSDEAGLEFHWPCGDMISNIRTLNLEGSCMDPEGLGELLKHTPHLESLSYTHHPKYRGVGVDWRAGEMVAMIQENCWQSLRSLRMGRYRTGESYWGAPRGHILSMKKFQVLEDLIVPLDLFRDDEGGLFRILPSSMKHVRLITDNYNRRETLSDPSRLERHPAFQHPDLIRGLELQTLEVLMHEPRYFGGAEEGNVLPAEPRPHAAGVRMIEVDHGMGGHCTCASPQLGR